MQRSVPALRDKILILLQKCLVFLSLASKSRTLAKYQRLPSLSYQDSLKVFEKILGPELEGGLGMFSEGYWLWPIGKYVELYVGIQEFELSAAFIKELNPLLENFYETLEAAHEKRTKTRCA